MGIPENIDALLVKHDITQESLARIAGVEPSSVTRWRKGAQIRRRPLEKICAYFNITEDDIISDRYGLASKEHGGINSYTDVPLLGSIAAGQPVDIDSADGSFPIPTVIHDRYPSAFLLRVDGSSMDRHLPDGSLALVDPDDAEPDGHSAYAVCVNGYTATIKRVNRLANGIELVPDSHDPTQRPIVFDYADEDAEEVTVIGKVVWATMPFDYEI